jgi:hypothetical protein
VRKVENIIYIKGTFGANRPNNGVRWKQIDGGRIQFAATRFVEPYVPLLRFACWTYLRNALDGLTGSKFDGIIVIELNHLADEFALLSDLGLDILPASLLPIKKASSTVAPSSSLTVAAASASLATIHECVHLISPSTLNSGEYASGVADPELTLKRVAGETAPVSAGAFYKLLSSLRSRSIHHVNYQDNLSRCTFGVFAFESPSLSGADVRHSLVECDRCGKRLFSRTFTDHYRLCVAEPISQARQSTRTTSTSTSPSLATGQHHIINNSNSHTIAHSSSHHANLVRRNKISDSSAVGDASALLSSQAELHASAPQTPRRIVTASQYTSPKSSDWLLLPENEVLSPEALRAIIFHARSSNPNPLAFHRTRYQSPDPNYWL